MRAQRGQVVLEEVKLWCMQNLGVLLAKANEVLELLDFIGAKAHQWRMGARQRLFLEQVAGQGERKTKNEFLESTFCRMRPCNARSAFFNAYNTIGTNQKNTDSMGKHKIVDLSMWYVVAYNTCSRCSM